MRRRRGQMAIAIAAVGMTFLLATPRSTRAQVTIPSASSTHHPFYYAMRPVSWYSWNGVWVRSNGRWAWRPTRRPDWQAYFRCRMGYGSAAYGWMFSPTTWVDVGVGGWMSYPTDRFYHTWDFWYLGPSGYAGFGSYGSGCVYPYDWSFFLATGWGYPGYGSYGYGGQYGYGYDVYRQGYVTLLGRLPPRAIGTRYPYQRDRDPRTGTGRSDDDRAVEADARVFIDPVRTESLDRTLWKKPGTPVWNEPDARQPRASIDPVRTESLDRTQWMKPGTAVSSDPNPGTPVRADPVGGSKDLSRRSAATGTRVPSSGRDLTSPGSKPVRAVPERAPNAAPTRNPGPKYTGPTKSVPSPKTTVPSSPARQFSPVRAPSQTVRPVARPVKSDGNKGRKQ